MAKQKSEHEKILETSITNLEADIASGRNPPEQKETKEQELKELTDTQTEITKKK